MTKKLRGWLHFRPTQLSRPNMYNPSAQLEDNELDQPYISARTTCLTKELLFFGPFFFQLK